MYRLSLAFRYLRRRKIAYVSVVAIAVGVMAMIVVNSVMEGFQRRIKDSIFRVDGSLKVQIRDLDPIDTPDYEQRILARLAPFMASRGGEIVAASPRLVQPAMLSTRDREIGWPPEIDLRQDFITLIGIDAATERRVTPLDELLDAMRDRSRKPGEARFDAAGSYRWDQYLPPSARDDIFRYQPEDLPPSSQPGIILGSQLAHSLYLQRGMRATIITVSPDTDPSAADIEPLQQRFVVTGCFESGRYEYDKHLAFCDIRVLRDFLGWRGGCSEVRLSLKDPGRAREVKEAILASNRGADEWLEVLTWEDQMRTLAQALEFERLAMWLVTAFVVIVAGVSIGGLLYMVVLEKTRDIGILQSMGATSGGIVQTFILYGGLLGLLGTLLGVWLGIYVSEHLNDIIKWLERVLDRPLFPPDVYEFGSLPSHLDGGMIVSYACFTFGWCLLVSILPAFFASRLDPLKCLAYE
ncbi:MAG: FtsX-like permease family protein [Planctomycetes bacterium]|nr:FtsX-like permease family protein [Planctomycetota bacterium]